MRTHAAAITLGLLTLAGTISPRAQEKLDQAHTAVPQAHEAFLRGMGHINQRGRGEPEHVAGARREFQKAIELDPGFARAYAGLGWAHWNDFVYLNQLERRLRIQAFELADKSIALADNALARRLRAKQFFAPESFGYYSGFRPKQPAEAVKELRRGLELEPDNADLHAELAYTLVFAGEPHEAGVLLDKAMSINPDFPPWYHRPAGIAHYLSGNYELAVPEFQAWYKNEPITYESLAWLAAAHAQAGDLVRARTAIAELPKRRGVGNTQYSWSQEYFANKYVFARDEDKMRFMEGLGKAGLPSALAQ